MSDEFDDLYGSKYLGVPDLKNTKPRLKIGKVEVAELREKNGNVRRKYVVLFEGVTKGLVINQTNANKLASVCGKQTSNWVGQRVELYSEPTTFGDGIRVRPLRKPVPPAAPNDPIPF